MMTFGIVALSVCGAGGLFWFSLMFWTKLVTGKPKTVPEALVRLLHLLARLFLGLAEGLDAGIIMYRQTTSGEICPTGSERMRELRGQRLRIEQLERVL